MREIPRDWSWIGNWAGKRATLTPDKEAFLDNTTDESYTFADMEKRANKVARILRNYGIEKGDRVATYSKNRFEMIDLFLATGKIGAILVPFNVRLAPREVEYLLGKTEPSLVLYDSDIAQKFEEVRPDIDILAMGKSPDTDDSDINEMLAEQSAQPVKRPKLEFDDPHMIVFTGGTTGLPKGAILSHRLIFWNSVNTCMSWGLRPDDIQPLLFPLFHTGGWNVLLVPFYHLAAKTILMGDFNPDETLRVIEEEECTIVIGVPTMFQMMAQQERFKKTDFSSVRVFISGGAPCPVAIMENYWNRGKPFKMGYGLTEVGPNNFYLPIDEIKEKPNSVGYPVMHCDMKIADKDGNEVPQGDVGELLLKGPHIFSGYWDEPEETKKTIEPDGWVHTGDLCEKDEAGAYYIVGRKKDMFISGGENVYPPEIEDVLYKHPAVMEAAVIGVPHDKWGEVGKAFIMLKPNKSATVEEIQDYLDGKLAKYKIPKHYEIREDLPMSAAGKILKRELEEEEKS